MSDTPTDPKYLDPKCAGRRKSDGGPCEVPFPMWESSDGRLWCPNHRDQADGEVVRWSAVEHGAALDQERRCVGRLRDGSTQCPAVSTTSVIVGDERVRCCSWHKKLFEQYGVLRPPARTLPAVTEVDPLPDEEEMRTDPSPNGNGSAPTNGESLSMRERIDRSAQDSYDEIEAALRRALEGTKKPKNVRCPHCSTSFRVNMPDHAAAIASAKLLLELVVSRPKPPEESPPIPTWPEGEEPDYANMSTADLHRLAFGTEPPPIPRHNVRFHDDDEEATG